MIDFDNIKDIQTNEGIIRHLDYKASINSIPLRLWTKPAEYPYVIISNTHQLLPLYEGQERITEIPTPRGEDKYGKLVSVEHGGNHIWYLADEPSDVYYSDSQTLKVGDKFTAYIAYNDNQWQDCPDNAAKLRVEWVMSDEVLGKIKLYATSSITRGSSITGLIDSNKETFYYIRTLDTAVDVDIEAPLITLSDRTGITTEVVSAPTQATDFDYYKIKYEAATAGSFPKSDYPYLNGMIALGFKRRTFRMTYVRPEHSTDSYYYFGNNDYYFGEFIEFTCKR